MHVSSNVSMEPKVRILQELIISYGVLVTHIMVMKALITISNTI